MAHPIKQHYVPQFYLRNFKDTSQENEVIHCFNTKTKKSYSSSISKVAQKKYFNESSENNLEYKLSAIEKESSKYIHNLVKNKKYKYLNDFNIRSNIAYFMSLQYIRTNDKREWIKNNSYELKEEISQEIEIPDKFKDLFDEFPSDEHIKDWHLNYIEKFSKKFFKYFYFKKWILIKNNTKLNFWTSDNPIAVWNPSNPPGLAQESTFIFFPISPKLCICLADPMFYSNLDKMRNIDLIQNILRTTSFKFSDDEDVRNTNVIQVHSCNLTVFSKKDDFDILKHTPF